MVVLNPQLKSFSSSLFRLFPPSSFQNKSSASTLSFQSSPCLPKLRTSQALPRNPVFPKGRRTLIPETQVGLRKGSRSFAEARAAGFTEESGTLGDTRETVLLLISNEVFVPLMMFARCILALLDQIEVLPAFRMGGIITVAFYVQYYIVRGGMLPDASKGIKQIGVIGGGPQGMLGVSSSLSAVLKEFGNAYSASYYLCMGIPCGSGILVLAGRRFYDKEGLPALPMGGIIDQTYLWKVGDQVCMLVIRRKGDLGPLDPFTEGPFNGLMMAQIEVLKKKGPSSSEIMHGRVVAFIVDNCSRIKKTIDENVIEAVDALDRFRAFMDPSIQEIIKIAKKSGHTAGNSLVKLAKP